VAILTRSGRRAAVTAARVIALTTAAMTIAGGVLIWLVDHDEFPNLGTGLWWALQTVTTVGFGDVVPTDLGGKIIGALLMIQGVALITVATATVAAWLIGQMRFGELEVAERGSLMRIERVEERLAGIERSLQRFLELERSPGSGYKESS
jgi:voltage-gated potassium channel